MLADLFAFQTKEQKLQKQSDDYFGYPHEHTVSIGDTNITGSIYFTKYLDWLGYAREAMVRSKVAVDSIISGEIILVTRNTAIAYLREYELYDEAILHVSVGSLSRTTATIYCRYSNTSGNHLYAVAKQLILFTNKEGKPRGVPTEFLKLPICYREKKEEEINDLLRKRMF